MFGSFRGSSTWMWSKFRSAPTTLAYYEIFHEQLTTLSAATMADYGFSSWESKHPRSAPYFLEYAPLLRDGGGLASYDSRMAFERFIPADGIDGHLSAEEKRYVGELMYQAQLSWRIPVLTCNRSLGRARALQKEFHGIGVLVCRNLFHQWASYSGQSIGSNSYFMDTIDLILDSSDHDPFLRMVNTWFGARSKSPADEKTFTTFLLMYFYLYGFAFDACDVVVDISALARDPELNRGVSKQLSNMVNADIDLSDVREEFDIATLDIPSRESFVSTIEQFVKIISGYLPSSRSIYFVEQIRDAAIGEWERFDFFTRRLRSVQTARIADTTAKLDRSKEIGALEIQREQLTSERNEMSALAEQLRQRLEAQEQLRAEANGAHAELAGKLADAETAIAKLEDQLANVEADKNQLRIERDSFVQQLTQAEAELASQHQAGLALGAERDGLAQQLTLAEAELDAQRQTGEALTAERDGLLQQLTHTEAELDAQRQAGAALTAERDGLARQLTHAEAELAALRQTCGALAVERDDLAAQLHEAVRQTDELSQSVSAIRASRDRLASRLEEHERSLRDLEQTVAKIQAERDRVSAQLAEAARERASLRSSIDAVAAQRDALLAVRSRGLFSTLRRRPAS